MSVRKSLGFSFLEKYASFVFTAVTVIVLSRLLTPVQTGVFAVASGLVNVAQIFRDMGVATYILQQKDLTKTQLRTAFTIALLMGIGFCLVFVALSGWIANFFGHAELRTIVLLLSINFLLVPFGSVGLALLRRRMDFGSIMRIGIANALVHSLTSIVLAWQGFGPMAMAWASVVGVTANIAAAQFYLRGEVFMIPSLVEWRPIFRFGIFASTALVLNEISQRMPEIIVGRVLGVAATGYYSRGNSFVTLFNQTAMDAIWPVASSGLAKLHRDDKPLIQAYRDFVSFVTVFGWPMLAVLAIMAQPIILVVFGWQWLPSVPVGRLLCLATACLLLGRINNAVLNSTGKVVSAFQAQAVVVFLQFGLLLVVAPGGLEGVAWAAVAVSAAYSLYTSVQVVRLLRCGWGDVFAALAPSLVITLATVAPLLLLAMAGLLPTHGGFDGLLIAASECLAAVVVWLVALRLLGHPLHGEIVSVGAYLRERKVAAPVAEAGIEEYLGDLKASGTPEELD